MEAGYLELEAVPGEAGVSMALLRIAAHQEPLTKAMAAVMRTGMGLYKCSPEEAEVEQAAPGQARGSQGKTLPAEMVAPGSLQT